MHYCTLPLQSSFLNKPLVGESSSSEVRAIISFVAGPNQVIPDRPPRPHVSSEARPTLP